jgi:hypothetical protein
MKAAGLLLVLLISGCAAGGIYELAARNPPDLPPQHVYCWHRDTVLGEPCPSARASHDLQLCVRRLERTSLGNVSIARAREKLSRCMAKNGWRLRVFRVFD